MAVVLMAMAVVGCSGGDETTGATLDPGTAAEAPSFDAMVADAPGALAELYASGGALLDGGTDAFDRQLAGLEGYPVVVNKWASWCAPCRVEWPFFQNAAAEHGDEVGFIGVDWDDTPEAATTFLETHPIPYPSFDDQDGKISESLATFGVPNTLYFDEQGELVYARQGEYATEEEFQADFEKYALGS